MASKVSLIVPVLNDAEFARRLVASLERTSAAEVVVVDGGNDAALDRLTSDFGGIRVLRSLPGRGRQMNAGAAAASGEWLLFLHADSQLPEGWQEFFDHEIDAVGGWFRFALADAAWQARLIERLVALRVRLLALPYGDQGLFVRRETFRALGGFREWPLLEDVEFVRRLVKAGPVVQPPLALRTSSRRWRQDGWLVRSVKNVAIIALYWCGVTPARLARWR